MIASRNYTPSDDLLPYVRRIYVFEADLSEDFGLEDRLLAEDATIRVLINGDWEAEVAPDEWRTIGKVMLFGGNSKQLRVRATGHFRLLNFAVRPCAWRALFKQPAPNHADTMVPLREMWDDLVEDLAATVKKVIPDETIVAAFETAVREQCKRIGRNKIDAKMALFEDVARTNNSLKMEEAAAQVGLSVRQLERRCLTAYGISPKAVLRRSRFLDMAEGMRGLSTSAEAARAMSRYFDQSHLNREFWRFCGMTPGKFAKATTPLFNAELKQRAEGQTII
jgi:AraC-like DNA-binding protein